MPLPYVIERLLAALDESGNARIFQGAQRVSITGLAPAARAENVIAVPSGKYAIIPYRLVLNPTVVPGTLNMTFTLNGAAAYDDIVDNAALAQPLDCFAVVRTSTPIRLTIVNNSVLAQNFETVLSYLFIQNEADYNFIMKLLMAFRVGVLK